MKKIIIILIVISFGFLNCDLEENKPYVIYSVNGFSNDFQITYCISGNYGEPRESIKVVNPELPWEKKIEGDFQFDLNVNNYSTAETSYLHICV